MLLILHSIHSFIVISKYALQFLRVCQHYAGKFHLAIVVVEHELVKVEGFKAHIEEINELATTLSIFHVFSRISEIQLILVGLIGNSSSSCLIGFPLLLLLVSVLNLLFLSLFLLDFLRNNNWLLLLLLLL